MAKKNVQHGLPGLLIFHTFMFFVFLAFALSVPEPVWGEEPRIRADAAVLMDYRTGQVYYAKRAYDRMHPASTTKMITAILALELGNLEDVVTISPEAGRLDLGSSLYLREGDRITLGNLVKGALMLSANDSTVAIGQHVAGDADFFVRLMNQKARAIGVRETQFVNTNGFSKPNHYSTAFDLALMARYAMHNPAFARIVGTKTDIIKWVTPEKEKEVQNTNKLLWMYPGATGIKTGTTSAAGGCLVASATRKGRTLIAVVLRSSRRYGDAAALLDYGFREIRDYRPVQGGKTWGRIPVAGGRAGEVNLIPARTFQVTIPQEEQKDYTTKVYLPKQIMAPVEKGQKIGEVAVFYKNREVARIPLLADGEVARKSIFSRLLEIL